MSSKSTTPEKPASYFHFAFYGEKRLNRISAWYPWCLWGHTCELRTPACHLVTPFHDLCNLWQAMDEVQHQVLLIHQLKQVMVAAGKYCNK